MYKGKAFRVSDLMRVSRGTPEPLQPREIGQRVRLNSGGPEMLVVDVGYGNRMVTAAWAKGEITVPAVCLTT
jgi:hypothetical protein